MLRLEFNTKCSLGTSKYPPRADLHGRQGSFLSSLAAVSLLSITSHHHQYHSHNFLRIHHAAVLSRQTPCAPELRLLSFPHGTRVAVQDLFGSMPVRVKRRAVDIERGAAARDWDALKHTLAALVLAWPSAVTVTLRNLPDDRSIIVRTGNGLSSSTFASKACSTLRQATLIGDQFLGSWVPIGAQSGHVSVEGAVSLIPVVTKRLQFLTIGIRPLPRDSRSNYLYEEINRLFANSRFGAEESIANPSKEKGQNAEDGRRMMSGYTERDLKGKRRLDRWPIFCVQVSFNEDVLKRVHSEIDVFFEEHYDIVQAIADLLHAVFYAFLKKHHFRPRQGQRRKDESSKRVGSRETQQPFISEHFTPNARTLKSKSSSHHLASTGDLQITSLSVVGRGTDTQRPESPFDLWTRVKSGIPLRAADQNKSKAPTVNVEPRQSSLRNGRKESHSDCSTKLLVGSGGKLLRVPFLEDDDTTTPLDSQTETSQEVKSDALQWMNPATEVVSSIDRRTDVATKIQRTESHDGTLGSRASDKSSLPNKIPPKDTESSWMGDLMSSWQNPVFSSAEPSIPTVFDENRSTGDKTRSNGTCYASDQGGPWHLLDSPVGVNSKLSKDGLRRAEVVGQVDRKFILTNIPSLSGIGESTMSLTLIDQHAADERCRVEQLMKEYFELSGDTSSLGPTSTKFLRPCTAPVVRKLKFELSQQDSLRYEQHRSYFERWGIVYRIFSFTNAQEKHKQAKTLHQMQIMELPPSISERCQSEPRLLIDLLRDQVTNLEGPESHGAAHHISFESSQSKDTVTSRWLARLHGCPQGILDMINSRACRSAIMFNDILSYDDCEDLLRRLTECSLPFQCAHGRPSMIPVVKLDQAEQSLDWHEDSSRCELGTALKKWME